NRTLTPWFSKKDQGGQAWAEKMRTRDLYANIVVKGFYRQQMGVIAITVHSVFIPNTWI
ncbi:unnamed protein product, partial [marine sediment metagenome]